MMEWFTLARVSEEEKKSLRVGTADLLDMLLEDEPDSKFSFALGADTFMDLTKFKWRRSEDIFTLLNARLIVFHRRDNECDIPSDHAIYTRMDEISVRLQEKIPIPASKSAMTLLNVRLPSVSSTEIRGSNDDKHLAQVLHSNVIEYIKSRKLYGFSNIKI